MELIFLMVDPHFIRKLEEIFEGSKVFSSAQKLEDVLHELKQLGETISVKDLKEFLIKNEFLTYSRNAPRGYSLNNTNILERSKALLMESKLSLFLYPDFKKALEAFL